MFFTTDFLEEKLIKLKDVIDKHNTKGKTAEKNKLDEKKLKPILFAPNIDYILKEQELSYANFMGVIEIIMYYRKAMLKLLEPFKNAYDICFVETLKTLSELKVYCSDPSEPDISEFYEQNLKYLETKAHEHGISGEKYFKILRDNMYFGSCRVVEKNKLICVDLDYEMKIKVAAMTAFFDMTKCNINVAFNGSNLRFIYKLLEQIRYITPYNQYCELYESRWEEYQIEACKRSRNDRMEDLSYVLKRIKWDKEKKALSVAGQKEQKKIMNMLLTLEGASITQTIYEEGIISKENIQFAINQAVEQEQLAMLPVLLGLESA